MPEATATLGRVVATERKLITWAKRVSPSTIRALSKYFEADWRIIPNGVDTALFRRDVGAGGVATPRDRLAVRARDDRANLVGVLNREVEHLLAATRSRLLDVHQCGVPVYGCRSVSARLEPTICSKAIMAAA